MGFFSRLFGKGGEARRFVSQSAYETNLAKQTSMSPQTLEALHGHGVTDESRLKLEVFFYTNTEAKAQALADALTKMGYSVTAEVSAGMRNHFLVNGWTSKIQMKEDQLVYWTQLMCQLGYENDCDFDGWGTNPDQE